jgi:hypothetical protein
MKVIFIALGAGVGCLLLAGSALAGPCAAQIDQVTKLMAATDAGTGPAGDVGGIPDTMDDPAGADPAGTDPAGALPAGTDPTGGEDQASSPGSGETAAQALARARAFDQAGDEAACLDEVNKARDGMAAQP